MMNTAIFLDMENLVHALQEQQGVGQPEIDLLAFRQDITSRGRILSAAAYADWRIPKYGHYVNKLMRAGFEIISANRIRNAKNISDIKMIVDLMECTHLSHLDAIMVVSGDSDFTPVFQALRRRGKRLLLASPVEQLREELSVLVDEVVQWRWGRAQPVRAEPVAPTIVLAPAAALEAVPPEVAPRGAAPSVAAPGAVVSVAAAPAPLAVEVAPAHLDPLQEQAMIEEYIIQLLNNNPERKIFMSTLGMMMRKRPDFNINRAFGEKSFGVALSKIKNISIVDNGKAYVVCLNDGTQTVTGPIPEKILLPSLAQEAILSAPIAEEERPSPSELLPLLWRQRINMMYRIPVSREERHLHLSLITNACVFGALTRKDIVDYVHPLVLEKYPETSKTVTRGVLNFMIHAEVAAEVVMDRLYENGVAMKQVLLGDPVTLPARYDAAIIQILAQPGGWSEETGRAFIGGSAPDPVEQPRRAAARDRSI